MAVAVDAAVASIGNEHDVKLKYTVQLRALNIQHMKNTLMVQVCAFPGSPNHQIPGVCVQVFRYGHSCLGIQAQYSGLCLGTHIQYSYSGIQVWNSDLGIQDWVYRLADKYKALTLSIHIQGIQVQVFTFRYTGLGIQVS